MRNRDSALRPDTGLSRRNFLAGAAGLLPMALGGNAVGAESPAKSNDNAKTLPPPKYTLAVHMNANFARQAKSMPVAERFALAAREGAKAYQIGKFAGLDLEEYRRHADVHGMRCASLAGTGGVGLSTGLTVSGEGEGLSRFLQQGGRSGQDSWRAEPGELCWRAPGYDPLGNTVRADHFRIEKSGEISPGKRVSI